MTTSPSIELTDEFARALDLLEAGRNLFLTGKAGSGKSTLIRHFMASTERNVLVAAPTGIAALNVDGYTIHRLFSFYPTITAEEVRSGRYYPAKFATVLRSLDTLIIDEASMVRADLFDLLVTALERFGPRPGTPFGGVQIVLVGDLFQLPPVVTDAEAEYFRTRYQTPYFFSADRFDGDDFPTVALTKVFRQLGDQRMTAILNAVREGALLAHARDELNSRTDASFEPPDGEFWLTLAPTNRIVTARNRQRLERLPGPEFTHRATANGDLTLFDPPVAAELRFKVGAQVMMLNNDYDDRWVNGSIGRIVSVGNDSRDGSAEDDDDDNDVTVTVELRGGSLVDVQPFTWEATRPVVDGGQLRNEVIGTYTQLPFTLAWAITIHKSQGQTLDNLIVDLTGGAFAYGQVYVALSRCTSMSGIVLTRPVFARDLKTDRRIIRFLRSAVDDSRERRLCAIGLCLVGDEGRLSRPRPVEIAVAFDDGTAISSVVNPQRDLGSARSDYGLTVDDVLLAPTLAEAWTLVAPMLAGCTPVGVEVDETLGLIDFELKRLGVIAVLPVGVDVPSTSLTAEELAGLRAGSALERARAAMAAAQRIDPPSAGASTFDDCDDESSTLGFLVTRDQGVPTPTSDALPTLSGLLRVSRAISAVLLGDGAVSDAVSDAVPEASSVTALAASQLRSVAERTRLTPRAVDRLQAVAQLLGEEIIDGAALAVTALDPAAVLVSGARVCFTGTFRVPNGRTVTSDGMEAVAACAGLAFVKSVTKTRCDALVVAEAGTQSGKARKAVDYDKPIITADEFFAWLAGR